VDADAQRRGVDGVIDRGAHVVFVRDVGLGEETTELVGDLFAASGIAVEDDDDRAVGRKTASGGFAHPRGTAGHEGGSVLQRHGGAM
jgi:hypothetical protein